MSSNENEDKDKVVVEEYSMWIDVDTLLILIGCISLLVTLVIWFMQPGKVQGSQDTFSGTAEGFREVESPIQQQPYTDPAMQQQQPYTDPAMQQQQPYTEPMMQQPYTEPMIQQQTYGIPTVVNRGKGGYVGP